MKLSAIVYSAVIALIVATALPGTSWATQSFFPGAETVVDPVDVHP